MQGARREFQDISRFGQGCPGTVGDSNCGADCLVFWRLRRDVGVRVRRSGNSWQHVSPYGFVGLASPTIKDDGSKITVPHMFLLDHLNPPSTLK